jgi:hypothetical protein
MKVQHILEGKLTSSQKEGTYIGNEEHQRIFAGVPDGTIVRLILEIID